jgi:lytic murein transglycosylase
LPRPSRAAVAASLTLALAGASASHAHAARSCQNTGRFEPWLAEFRVEAEKAGVTKRTIDRALGGMTLDLGIIARDRRQGFFAQSFLDFSAKLVTPGRVSAGRQKLAQHKALFDAVEKQYGAAPAVIGAYWALESSFGSGMGNLPVLRSLAALAYDCRRGEMFRGELMAALKIIDRGDLKPEDMVGSWAGELGQTQFLPSHYFNHAVDYDKDGRRDLMRSVPDVVASTAAFLISLGWKPGELWLEEVRVPASLAWDQADLAITHPVAEWAKWGVVRADGKPLAMGAPAASLLLPMGRNGPAFLAYPNFQIFIKWNQSLNYAITAAYLAARLAGAPQMGRGRAPVTPLTAEQMKELQQLLAKRGYYQGEADGRLGAGTRAAVKAAQLKLGLAADSYPTAELLGRLGGGAADAGRARKGER